MVYHVNDAKWGSSVTIRWEEEVITGLAITYRPIDLRKCEHTTILDFISEKFTRPISTISKFVKEGGNARTR